MRLHGRADGLDRRTARPSDVASGRLRDELRREVAELRVRLEELALRSEVHQVTGNEDGFEATIVEQRQMLHQFERRVRHRIADAIVEREAEVVLNGAVVDLQRAGADTGPFAWSDDAGTRGRISGFSRAVAAAAAAALATMFMLSSGTTGLDPASAPSTGSGPAATASAADRGGSAASADVATGRDGLVIAGEAVSDGPSLRERFQRRVQAAPDAPQGDGQFFEQLLTRLFGAVASVTTTNFSQPADALDPTDLSTGGLEARVEEIVEDAFEVTGTTEDAGDDGTAVSEAATDEGPETDEEAEPAADITDDESPAGASEEPGDEDPADDSSADDRGFGGFSSGTESGSSASGSGLLSWG
jgi:hypothetical protein